MRLHQESAVVKTFDILSRMFGVGLIAAILAATATGSLAQTATPGTDAALFCGPNLLGTCDQGACLSGKCQPLPTGIPPNHYCCY